MSNENSMNSRKDKPKGPKGKKTKSLNSVLKTVILVLLSVIFLGGVITFGIGFAWIKSAKPLNVAEVFDLNQTTYIVDKNDKVIDKLHANENRTMTSLDQIPEDLQNAIIAIEDKRFYKHNGIDPYRMMGALREDIKSGKAAQGGSTITQQLIKNIYLTPDKLIKRKVVEIYYALQLERRFTKKQILEAYLNTIGLGHNVAGVKEAALYYYGKDVNQLNLSESAMLAGITNNPSLYSPYLNFENSTKRQKLILSEMLKQGMIDQARYDEALNYEIKLTKVQTEVETSYFSDMVIREVSKVLETELGYTEEEAMRKLFNGGLKIVATIDTDMQNAVEEAFGNTKLFPKSKEDQNGVIQPEAAAVIIDHSTGEIKAVMGGRSEKVKRGLNRATQSLRQPGSSIKPLAVYAPALDNGYSVASVFDDSPTSFNGYAPNNYDRKFRGLISIREAIQHSVNVVAVKIVQELGTSRSFDYLKRFGITTLQPDDKNLSALSLGGMTKGVKPIEMAAAYGVFPNKGIYIKPISFTQILDRDGSVIYENKPKKERVLSEQVSYLMVDIMEGVVKGGTGGNAALGRIPVAGKTGTTDRTVDAWFVGYTPYYTAAVWMGHDDPKPLGFTGGSYPAKLWRAIMENVHKDLASKDFGKPDGIESKQVCGVSGKSPSELCALDPRGSMVRTEYYIRGTEPHEDGVCDLHVTRDIDIETGMLASPNCPSALIQSKVFVLPRGAEASGGPVTPGAAQIPANNYEAPTEVCTKHLGGGIIDIFDPNNSGGGQPPITPNPPPSTENSSGTGDLNSEDDGIDVINVSE